MQTHCQERLCVLPSPAEWGLYHTLYGSARQGRLSAPAEHAAHTMSKIVARRGGRLQGKRGERCSRDHNGLAEGISGCEGILQHFIGLTCTRRCTSTFRALSASVHCNRGSHHTLESKAGQCNTRSGGKSCARPGVMKKPLRTATLDPTETGPQRWAGKLQTSQVRLSSAIHVWRGANHIERQTLPNLGCAA
jgi:hypothetical protein